MHKSNKANARRSAYNPTPVADEADTNKICVCRLKIANILSLRQWISSTTKYSISKPMQFHVKIKRSYFNKTRIITRNHVRCKTSTVSFSRTISLHSEIVLFHHIISTYNIGSCKNVFVLSGRDFSTCCNMQRTFCSCSYDRDIVRFWYKLHWIFYSLASHSWSVLSVLDFPAFRIRHLNWISCVSEYDKKAVDAEAKYTNDSMITNGQKKKEKKLNLFIFTNIIDVTAKTRHKWR